jgi:hypothetical protein
MLHPVAARGGFKENFQYCGGPSRLAWRRKATPLPKEITVSSSLPNYLARKLSRIDLVGRYISSPENLVVCFANVSDSHALLINMTTPEFLNVLEPQYSRYLHLRDDIEAYLTEKYGAEIDFRVFVS